METSNAFMSNFVNGQGVATVWIRDLAYSRPYYLPHFIVLGSNGNYPKLIEVINYAIICSQILIVQRLLLLKYKVLTEAP